MTCKILGSNIIVCSRSRKSSSEKKEKKKPVPAAFVRFARELQCPEAWITEAWEKGAKSFDQIREHVQSKQPAPLSSSSLRSTRPLKDR